MSHAALANDRCGQTLPVRARRAAPRRLPHAPTKRVRCRRVMDWKRYAFLVPLTIGALLMLATSAQGFQTSAEPWLRPDGTVGYQHRKGRCPASLAKQHASAQEIVTRYLEVRRLAVFEGLDACGRAINEYLGSDAYESFVEGHVITTTRIRKETVTGSQGTVADQLNFDAMVTFTRLDGTSYTSQLAFGFILGRDRTWNTAPTLTNGDDFGVGSVKEVWDLHSSACFLQFGARPTAGTLGSGLYTEALRTQILKEV